MRLAASDSGRQSARAYSPSISYSFVIHSILFRDLGIFPLLRLHYLETTCHIHVVLRHFLSDHCSYMMPIRKLSAPMIPYGLRWTRVVPYVHVVWHTLSLSPELRQERRVESSVQGLRPHPSLDSPPSFSWQISGSSTSCCMCYCMLFSCLMIIASGESIWMVVTHPTIRSQQCWIRGLTQLFSNIYFSSLCFRHLHPYIPICV